MKILVVEICNYIDFPTGGQLSFVRNMMSSFGNDLMLVGVSTDGTPVGKWTEKTIDGITFDYFSIAKMAPHAGKPLIPRRLTGLMMLKRHKKAIFSKPFDIIFIQSSEALFFVPEAHLSKTAIDIPGLGNIVASSRYVLMRTFSGIYSTLYYRHLSKLPLVWATASKEEIKQFANDSKGLLNESDIIQLPTRFDSRIFRVLDKDFCRESLHLPENKKLFLTVGRLNWYKGWKMMIDSFRIVLRSEPESELYFIGDGEDADSIKEYLQSSGLGEHVHLCGRQSPDIVALYLNACDVFMMASFREGWSTSLVEACACGIPCVTTDFSSASDMISDQNNGFVCKSRSEEEFARLLLKALSLQRTCVQEFDKRYGHLSVERLKSEMLPAIFNKIRMPAS